MDVYQFNFSNKEPYQEFKKDHSILLLGEFELFHKGHQTLFEKAKEIQKNQKIGILIIENKLKEKIFSLENRLENLARIGFDFVIYAEFNFEFKSLDGKEFIDYLDQKFFVDNYILGQDFCFGKNRKYNAFDLKEWKENNCFVIPTLVFNNTKISSTNIKQMYEFGELNTIKQLLVNPIEVDIRIIDQRIIWNDFIKPHFGIYFFRILIDDYWYCGLIRFSIDKLIYFQLINYDLEKNILDQKSKIQILDICRIITNSRYDKISENDLVKAKNFFTIKEG